MRRERTNATEEGARAGTGGSALLSRAVPRVLSRRSVGDDAGSVCVNDQGDELIGDGDAERLTSRDYWDGDYSGQVDSAALEVDGFRNRPSRRIVEVIEDVGLSGKRSLEIGAGNSAFLCYLARKYADTGAVFTGLDYSPHGCELLARRATREGVSVNVVRCDLFEPTDDLTQGFDIVYSLGVAEHFQSLPRVLTAMKRYVAPGGALLTVMPNMAGVLGVLTRRYSPAVYEKHVPHDLSSLVRGHQAADLRVERSGYLCSTDFGVLSSCFPGPASRGWQTYLWLSRLSKSIWALEAYVGELPKTAFFSPYLYAFARMT